MCGENNTLHIIEKIGYLSRYVVVPIFISAAHSSRQIKVLGSGFIVERKGINFFVTAFHVLKDNMKDTLVVNIKGKSAFLNGLPFFKSEENDLAVFPIDDKWFLEYDITEIDKISLDVCHQEEETINAYFLLGYPGSKNKLNETKGNIDRKVYCYSFYKQIENPLSKTELSNPIAFYFDKDDVVLTDRTKIIPTAFSGCSGGPVLAILKDKFNNLYVQLVGIFQGWHKQSREVICIRSEALIALIDDKIQQHKLLKIMGISM